MNNNEIIRIERKNPNKPNELPVVLGIFPAAAKHSQLTAELVNSIVFNEIAQLAVEDLKMEQNLIEEFDRLKSRSNMVAAQEIMTTTNKRGMIVYLIEK